ncbi:MAG: T9SS type A sorting domain-containing protein [Bacteroidales bacterium]
MKKLILFIALVGICHSFVISQEWAPVGAKWHYSSYSWGPPYINSPLIIESIGDTVINNKFCKVLIGSGLCSFTTDANYTFSEDEKVYLFNETSNSFHILYDFSALAGETWTIVPSNPVDSFVVIVDSVYTRTINGNSYKVQDINTVDPYSTYSLVGEVIKGIGNVHFLFPLYSTCDPWPGPIRCYNNTESIIMFDTIPCDTTYQYYNLVYNYDYYNLIEIFPNPTTEFITINMPINLPIEEATIYNHLGQKVLTTRPENNKVDVSRLKPGIYFIEVKTKDGRWNKKFIKE